MRSLVGFKVGLLLVCALAFGASAQPILAPSEQPPQAPGVQSEQKPDNAVRTEQKSEAEPKATQEPPASVPGVLTGGSHGERQPKAENGAEEGTEFWPPFLGYRLKITDTIIAAFTAALFFATYALYLATRNLVRGSENTAERQLRAYLYTSKAVAQNIHGLANFYVEYSNTGQTPALNVRFRQQVQLVDTPIVGPIPIDNSALERRMGNIGAGDTFYANLPAPRQLTEAELAEVVQGTKAIVLHGRVEYRDVFGRDRWTNHRNIICGNDSPLRPDGRMGRADEGNESN